MNKILIVDDEPYILELLKINLEAAGYLVKTLVSGKKIVDICLEFQPEIILLDIMLPDIDGLELCKIIKSHPILNKIGIILVSAKGEIDDKVYGLDLGADDYIAKPFSIKEIISRVNALSRRVSVACKVEKNTYIHRELKFDFNNKVVYKN
ncbi:MAG: response regulator, partial [Cetobacterium sp.]